MSLPAGHLPGGARPGAARQAALGYTLDRRAGVSDIDDPRRLNPVLVFQQLDASEAGRRRERNRPVGRESTMKAAVVAGLSSAG